MVINGSITYSTAATDGGALITFSNGLKVVLVGVAPTAIDGSYFQYI